MSVVKSFISAFLMYTRIPMPSVEWKEENRRYSLCFFPLCGAVIAGLLVAWRKSCVLLGAGEWLFAAVCVAIPVAVTGGIHLDGFCDVCDALASCSSRERRLEIMSDPHIGSFAVIRAAVYLLLQAGLFSQVKSGSLMIVCSLCFVTSRAMSGLCAVTFRSARSGGSLQQFVKPAHRNVTIICELLFIAVSSAAAMIADQTAGAAALAGMTASMAWFRHFSYKKFGGITGDLAGFFLQIGEISGMACAVASCLIRGVLV